MLFSKSVYKSRQSKSDNVCPPFFFLSLWDVGTFLSAAFTWVFVNNYDTSETNHSLAAAIMTSVTLFGSTLGHFCCCADGSESKTGIGNLWECFKTFDCASDLPGCVKLLAFCGLLIVIIPSFGILQLASSYVMVQSLVLNTATNVRMIAGFIAAFDFLAALCGAFFFPCFLCCVAGDS